MSESSDEQKNTTVCTCRLLHHCKFRSFMRLLTPALLWIIYICLGSLIFTAIENPSAIKRRDIIAQIKREMPIRLRNISEYIRMNRNCSGSYQMEQKAYLENDIKAISYGLEKLLQEADLGPNTRTWDFFPTLSFCITAISTIGKFGIPSVFMSQQ